MKALLFLFLSLFCVFGQRSFEPRIGIATQGFAWDPSPDVVVGYRIYSGPESGRYTASVDVGNVTQCCVVRLPGAKWYAVTAYAADGTESVYSNEISIP